MQDYTTISAQNESKMRKKTCLQVGSGLMTVALTLLELADETLILDSIQEEDDRVDAFGYLTKAADYVERAAVLIVSSDQAREEVL